MALHHYRVSNLEERCHDNPRLFCLPSKKVGDWPYATTQWTVAAQSVFFSLLPLWHLPDAVFSANAKINRETADRERVSRWITAKAKLTLNYVLAS